MRVTQGRTSRCRATSAVGLLVAVAAAMLAQVAIADTASAAAPRPMTASVYSAAVHHVAATRVTIDHNGWAYDVGRVPLTGVIIGNGRVLGGATIQIWSRPTSAVGTWVHIANTPSNSSGRYTVNINATTVRYYQARFAGTYSWAASNSPFIHLYARKVGTKFASVTANNVKVGYGGGTDLRGIVIDIRNARVAGQHVELWSGLPGAGWTHIANANTNSVGAYIFSPRKLTKTISYQVRFPATVKWTASVGPVQVITVAKTPPVVTPLPVTPVWTPNAKLAADTAAAVNVYRVQQGLKPLVIMPTSAFVDSCVAKNSTGVICDPGVLASGFLTGPAVAEAWRVSPEHNAYIVGADWVQISCAAYTFSDGHSGNVGCQTDF